MLFLVTAIFAGLSVAYARTKTFSGSTIRDWKYTITGNYNESNGAVSGTTSSTFSVHKGCYTEAEAYELNFDKSIYLTKGMRIIMKRQKKIIASILAAAFVIGGSTCYAGSVYSMLYSDQSSVKTAILGNTTGKYRIVSNNNKNSKHAVELFLYKGKDSDDLKKKTYCQKNSYVSG